MWEKWGENRIIERKLRSTKVRLFTVPCCSISSIILFSSEGRKKTYLNLLLTFYFYFILILSSFPHQIVILSAFYLHFLIKSSLNLHFIDCICTNMQ